MSTPQIPFLEIEEEYRRERVESQLRAKYETGDADTGLYRDGSWYLVMDVVEAEMTFTWFEQVTELVNDLTNNLRLKTP